MKYYNQTDLFWTLISAARNPQGAPDAALLQRYKEKRIQRAIKALRSKNIFLFTEGTRTSVNLNDVTTIYTQPAGVRLLVIGYSDNFFYGSTAQTNALEISNTEVIFPQMHRVRIVGSARVLALSEDLMAAQSGASGQPRYTSTLLPVPFILEPDEQLAVDLAYDTAMVAPTEILPQSFIFFCVKVKDQLTPEDELAISEIKAYIASHNYQRGIFLNCATLAREDVHFDTALAGGVANCVTRPANGPLLITGVGTTLRASRLTITDSSDGHSFSLHKPMRSSALNVPDNSWTQAPLRDAVAGAPVWEHYYEFPASHLLRPGASLACEVVNGGFDALGNDAVLDTQADNVIMFQAATV